MPEAKRDSQVQAAEVTYELHSLGLKAFQDLCVTLVANVWGQTVQSFFSSKDGGRDGAFHGRSTSVEGKAVEGSYTIQCKFTSKLAKQLTLSDLADELENGRCLAGEGLADNYLLFANAA